MLFVSFKRWASIRREYFYHVYLYVLVPNTVPGTYWIHMKLFLGKWIEGEIWRVNINVMNTYGIVLIQFIQSELVQSSPILFRNLCISLLILYTGGNLEYIDERHRVTNISGWGVSRWCMTFSATKAAEWDDWYSEATMPLGHILQIGRIFGLENIKSGKRCIKGQDHWEL